MSVPLTNALSPAPRSTSTRIAVVGVDALAGRAERLVHLPGHRVAGLGAVEGQDRDGAVVLEDRLVSHVSLAPVEADQRSGRGPRQRIELRDSCSCC